MQYFVQSFTARQAFPKHYDMLMDIATEEFSHLEVVGATITMLLDGINADLKVAAEESPLMKLTRGKAAKEEVIHDALTNPQFLVLSGGGPTLTDSNGVPWTAAYVNANGDLTVDLRSNMAAEGRAKIVYEYLMQFTDDPLVKESLSFLMTREVAHYQMFGAALETVQPNFPMGVLQGDPRYTHLYFNMSNGAEVRGPWNEGQGPWRDGEQWVYIDEPLDYVRRTEGLSAEQEPQGSSMDPKEATKLAQQLGQERSDMIRAMIPKGENQWSAYGAETLRSPRP
jgi:Mn-containing catalase